MEQQAMDWYEADVRHLELTKLTQVNGSRPPVFYGSSSLRLWETLATDFDPRVLNLGFGGSTLEACNYFFDRLIVPVNPQSLLLYAGDNDLGDGRSPQEVLGWFKSLADKVERSFGPIPVGFISVKPSPVRYSILDRIRALNEAVGLEIKSRPSAYYVDVFSSMLDENSKPRPEYFLEDGLHMSHEGYLLWSRILQPYRHQIFTL
jgi:lysophospholipase L1-like esterase